LAERFVLLRITNMRGVDLDQFDFDYDLTWAAFFLNGRGKVYGRYGGRDAGSPDRYLTLAGLKAAMREALATHQREPKQELPRPEKPPRTVEQFAAARSTKAGECIHCHQVYDFRRAEQKAAGQWRLENVWVYPLPENVGLTLDPEQGNRVKAVKPDSAAARAGLRSADVLKTVNGQPVASFADLQYALHRAGDGSIPVAWQRGGETRTGELRVPAGWRVTDISWRASMWDLEPSPCVYGVDLTAREKKVLGLSEKGLAFRQCDFVPEPAKKAGIQAGDVVFGLDGQRLELTMLQFNVYVRLHYKVGERLTFNVLRGGKRIEIPMVLPKGS
jgi:hypothetical protein